MCPEEQTPIYLKAKEIQQLVFGLIALVEQSELPEAREIELDLLEDDLFQMKMLSTNIVSYVGNASASYVPYDLKMENAVLIKKAAHELLTYAYSIEDMGLKDIDYLDLIYEEIEVFRILFIDWINTFELWKYDEDDWGLFNPEGIKIVYTGYKDDPSEEFYDEDEYSDDEDDFDEEELDDD